MYTIPLLQPTQLHIPDGFLNLPISLFCWVVTGIVVAIAVRKVRQELGGHQIPLMGIMAAFIFAAQMINFPIAGGTSGHLLGGVLAAVTLGPWAGMLVMTSVIAVQGLLFQDGGLLVMGANILNMGLLTVLIGYGLHRLVLGRGRSVRMVVIGIAAWLSVIAGALATSLELWLSGTSPLELVIPAMLGVHALIGIGEALITVAAVSFIQRTRPDLLEAGTSQARGSRGWIYAGLLVSLVVVLLSPFASADPDGLERVAEKLGFFNRTVDSPFQLLSSYTIPFLGDSAYSTILAGLIGVLVVAGVTYGVTKLMQRPAGH